MKDFLKEYYFSGICEANKCTMYSEEANLASLENENIYKELRKNLSKEDFALFEKYLNNDGITDTEDEFHAFRCGAKTALEFFIGIISAS